MLATAMWVHVVHLKFLIQVNLDMTDSMGPGKLVRHVQNLSYTYDEYLICIGLGPRISSVICKNQSYIGPSYPSSPVHTITDLMASYNSVLGIVIPACWVLNEDNHRLSETFISRYPTALFYCHICLLSSYWRQSQTVWNLYLKVSYSTILLSYLPAEFLLKTITDCLKPLSQGILQHYSIVIPACWVLIEDYHRLSETFISMYLTALFYCNTCQLSSHCSLW